MTHDGQLLQDTLFLLAGKRVQSVNSRHEILRLPYDIRRFVACDRDDASNALGDT